MTFEYIARFVGKIKVRVLTDVVHGVAVVVVVVVS